ncbi:MAG: C1 family peptidase [Bacteroidales bacterium]|nr:C1 family peptidase [Bacteroidales bacterium]
MKQLFFTIIFMLPLLLLSAQGQKGAISAEMLNNMHSKYKESNSEGIENAIRHNNLKDLAKSRYTNGGSDTYFSNRVKTSGVTNQKSSGRCWLFTGLNVLRPIVMEKKQMKEFKFSQAYLFFYDQLEKSNLFLEGIIATKDKPMDDKRVEWLIKNPIGDGGQWTGLVDLVDKYGAVPADVMPESYQADNTSKMSGLLRIKLREDALVIRKMAADGANDQKIALSKAEMLNDIYRILALSLGEPTQEFEWRYKDKEGNITELKKYTPKSFYDEFVGVDLNEYVMLMNDPTRPYDALYEIDYDRHRYDGNNWKYINLEADIIKEFAKASILDNQAMYFSCDVGKQYDGKNGYLDMANYDYASLMGVEFNMDKTERIKTFASGSSHGMTLVAVDVNKDNKITKWLLENSWGQRGYQGHLIMSDDWFNEYMFRLVINKKYIDKKTLKILEEKATLLPPWDPMFSEEI